MKKHYFNIAKLTLGISMISTSVFAQSTVTVNKATTYQNIDGFGGFAEMTDDFINDPAYVKMIINDLGATIIRDLMTQEFEEVNENNDPKKLDMTKMNFNGDVKRRLSALKALKAEADAKGEPIKFLTSIWSPAAWMKYTKTVSAPDPIWNRLITSEEEAEKGGTDEVIKDMKDELAEYIQAYLTNAKKEGVEMYALSIQNELAFAQPFPSCVYSPLAYANTMAVVGKRLKDNNINTLLVGPEDIGDLGRFATYLGAIGANPEALSHFDISAVHAYATDAVTAGSQSATIWDGMYRVSNRKKKVPFWQTETSGYGTDYEAAMSLGRAMYVALKFGKVSAWLFWGLSHPQASEGLTASDKKPTSRYYVSKNFYRYVRPGATSVEATSTDTDVLALAFQHDEKKTLSIVLINNSKDGEKKVKLNFANNTATPTSFIQYITSATDNCVSKGSINADGTITLPKYSVTTLVGNNSQPIITDLEDELATNEISLFPNPANEQLNAHFANNLYSNYTITDLAGKILISNNITHLDEVIDISILPKGMYLFSAKGVKNYIQKIVVE